MEHRWGQRVTVNLAVKFHRIDEQYGGRLENLSASGGWIATRVPMRDLTLVKVTIEGTKEPLRSAVQVEGFVVRHSSEGFGIEWNPHAPRSIASLLRHLVQQAPAVREAPRSATGEAAPEYKEGAA